MQTHLYFFYSVFLLFLSSLYSAQEKNIFNAKISLHCTYHDEIIELAGLLNNQNSINKIIQLLEPATISKKTSPEPSIYRYPYDINYSDTNATWDTIVASTNFFQQGIKDMAWFPDGNKLIIVGEPKGGTGSLGIVGRIYSFSENGSALYNDGKYTITWGGLNSTALTVSAVAIHPLKNYFIIGGVRTPEGTTHRLVYLDETISSTIIVQDFDHGSTVRSIAWSPNGNYVAVAGEVSNNINLRIYRFDTTQLTELTRCQYTWHTTNSLCSVQWHPSGNYIAIAGGISSSTHLIKVLSFDHESLAELIGARTTNNMAAGFIPDIAWTTDGTRLATAHYSTVATGPRIYSFNNNLTLSLYSSGGTTANEIYSCDISPDGAYISAGRSAQIDTYSYYDSAGTLVNILNFAFATSPIRKIRWNHDGNFLAFGADNGDLKVLKLNENNITLAKRIKKELLAMYQPGLHMYNTTQNILQPLAIANSNAFVSYAAQTPITYTRTGTQTFGDSTNMRCMDWSPDGNYLAFGGDVIPQVYIYARNGNLLDIVQQLTFGVANIAVDSIRFSPNGKYIAIGNNGNSNTKIFSFNGEYAKEVASTTTGPTHIEWFPDSSTLLLNGQVFSFTGTALFALDPTFRRSASLDSTGQYFAYITLPNTLVVARYTQNTVTTVTSTPVSDLPELDRLSWNNPSMIATWNAEPNTGIAVYQFDGSSLSLVGTTPISTIHINVDNAVSFDTTGNRFIVQRVLDGANILEFATNAPTGPLVQIGSISNSASTIYALRYSPDNNYIAAAGTNGRRYTMLFTRDTTPPLMSLASTYTVIKGTSDNITAYQELIIDNSYSSIALSSLAIDNSNVLVTKDPLIKANSNTVAGLLLATSRAISNFVIQNSQASITTNNLIIANSYANIYLSNLIQANSDVLVTYQPLIINNSNATAGLLVATSDAVSGLLVATSNAAAGLLVATSNATAGLLVTTSYAATSLTEKLIPLDTIDTGPAHIHFNAPLITMSYNVLLSTDHQLFVHTSGVVNGNGHSITFAKGEGTFFTIDSAITTTFQNVIFKDYNDSSVSIGAGASLIFGQNCHVELGEPQTLSRTWSFAGQSLLDAHNNSITVGTGAHFLSSLVNSSFTIANASLLNVRDNNIRAADDNAALIFNNAQLNLSSDFTYSIGSMLINNDVTVRGTSIFNYSTIMGLTIASQSKLTIDQGTSFNYAPAGNFRNLLSLTDSSATLFFNNASLLATATGPRLTKGTLLIDGIMNIQSSAVSNAQAIILGDETPTDDLILTFLPNATINLLSGFLNYANAQ
jgi:hypothetical protein